MSLLPNLSFLSTLFISLYPSIHIHYSLFITYIQYLLPIIHFMRYTYLFEPNILFLWAPSSVCLWTESYLAYCQTLNSLYFRARHIVVHALAPICWFMPHLLSSSDFIPFCVQTRLSLGSNHICYHSSFHLPPLVTRTTELWIPYRSIRIRRHEGPNPHRALYLLSSFFLYPFASNL